MKYEQLTHAILGAAMAVLNDLKPGLDEKLYENALVIELAAGGHTVEQQREYPVHYGGHFIGSLVPDLIVDGKVIVDPKVASGFNETHVAQMLGYLNITHLDLALLLNFKEAKLGWKRVVTGAAEKPLTTDGTDRTEQTPPLTVDGHGSRREERNRTLTTDFTDNTDNTDKTE